jgi:hypothetical protein
VTIIPALFRLTFTFTLLFTISIALIRAQPYDDSDLRAFLTPPEGCPAPCFMGIRPGVTTVDEAVEILEAHEWVGDVENNVTLGSNGIYSCPISWNWSDTRPDWLNIDEKSCMWTNTNNIVTSAWVRTNYAIGDFWLAFGRAERSIVVGERESVLPGSYYQGIYLQEDFLVRAGGTCPVTNYWFEKTSILFQPNLSQWLYDPQGYEFPWDITLMCFSMMNIGKH